MTRSSYWDCAIILFVAGLVVFFNLGGIPLLDPDEPVYAQTAKEMLAHHSFISPYIFGEFWYDKPPMYYWLVIGAAKLFGFTAFAARFPSALLGVAGCLIVYFFVKEIFNRRTAFISALVLVTSIEYFYLAKAAVTDITLTFFLTISLLSFLRKKYYLFYFFMGLAVVTKGPIGLFPGIIGLVYLACTRNLSELKRARFFSGMFLMFLVILPWYGTMAYLHGSDFVDTFLGFHNLTRFASPEHPDKNRWYFYIPVLLVGFFPWCTLLLQSMYRSLTETGKKSAYLLFFNIWAIIVFLFFSAAQTKLVSYILPMYPAIAILVGWYINEIWDEFYVPSRNYSWIVLLFILLVGFSYGSWKGLAFFPGTENAGLFLIFDFVFLGIFSLYFLWKRQTSNAFILHILGMIGFAFIISGMLFPLISGQFSSAAIAQEFKALDKEPSQAVYITKFLRPGVAFYSDIYGNEYDPSKPIQEIDALLQKNPQAWFVLRQVDYDALPVATKGKLILIKTVDNNMILQVQSNGTEESNL